MNRVTLEFPRLRFTRTLSTFNTSTLKRALAKATERQHHERKAEVIRRGKYDGKIRTFPTNPRYLAVLSKGRYK